MGLSQLAHEAAAPAADTPQRWSPARLATTAASAALAAFLLWRTFHAVDLTAVWALLAGRGPVLLLPLGAYVLTMTVDSLGWRRLLGALGHHVSLTRLVGLRVSIEAIQLSLPWGSVISESLTPALLRQRFGVPLSEAIAATAARKCLFGSTQAGFLALAVVAGGTLLASVARATNTPTLPMALLGVAAVLLMLTGSAMTMLASGSVASWIRARLSAIRLSRLRSFLDRRHDGFGHFDTKAAHLFRPRSLAGAAPFVFGVWMAETFETWLLLNALGVPVSFLEAIPIEAGASVLRILGVAVPAGIGVQEVGYVAFIAATGIPDPVSYGAAFAVVKRAKEALWTITGYSLLLRWRS
jgi:uncharacterized protein (TIRG00374 family)